MEPQEPQLPKPLTKSPRTLAYSNIKNKLLEEKREARRKRRALKKAQGTLTTASGGVEVMSDESEDDSNVSDPEEDSDFAAQVEAEVKRINSITSASWKPAATAGASSSSTDNKEGIWIMCLFVYVVWLLTWNCTHVAESQKPLNKKQKISKSSPSLEVPIKTKEKKKDERKMKAPGSPGNTMYCV